MALRASSPAPVRHTQATATWSTTSALCARVLRARAPPVSAIVLATSRRRPRPAKIVVKASEAARHTPSVSAARRRSGDSATVTGTGSTSWLAAPAAPIASSSPNPPPSVLRIRLSASSRRSSCPDVAPSAWRIARSRPRSACRANSSPARLAQAAISTQPARATKIPRNQVTVSRYAGQKRRYAPAKQPGSSHPGSPSSATPRSAPGARRG